MKNHVGVDQKVSWWLALAVQALKRGRLYVLRRYFALSDSLLYISEIADVGATEQKRATGLRRGAG